MSRELSRILLVEESELLAEITAFRLELLGYEVVCRHQGKDALAYAAEHPLELIMLDASLSDQDGMAVINAFASDEKTNEIPILLLSTDADLDTVEQAFQAGATDYLVTPFDPAVLQQKVADLIAARTTVTT